MHCQRMILTLQTFSQSVTLTMKIVRFQPLHDALCCVNMCDCEMRNQTVFAFRQNFKQSVHISGVRLYMRNERLVIYLMQQEMWKEVYSIQEIIVANVIYRLKAIYSALPAISINRKLKFTLNLMQSISHLSSNEWPYTLAKVCHWFQRCDV